MRGTPNMIESFVEGGRGSGGEGEGEERLKNEEAERIRKIEEEAKALEEANAAAAEAASKDKEDREVPEGESANAKDKSRKIVTEGHCCHSCCSSSLDGDLDPLISHTFQGLSPSLPLFRLPSLQHELSRI